MDRYILKKVVIRAAGLAGPGAAAIRTRHLGSSLGVDLHVKVDPNMSVTDGHDVSEIVKHALLERGPEVIDVVVHLEPFRG